MSTFWKPKISIKKAPVGIMINDIPIFDDLGSYGHTVLGWFAVKYPIIAVGFITYQIAEKEPRQNTTGDFIEFNLGIIAALLS
jgi:hypothetical protein